MAPSRSTFTWPAGAGAGGPGRQSFDLPVPGRQTFDFYPREGGPGRQSFDIDFAGSAPGRQSFDFAGSAPGRRSFDLPAPERPPFAFSAKAGPQQAQARRAPQQTSSRLAAPQGLGGLMQSMLAVDAHIEDREPSDPLDQVLQVNLAIVGRQIPHRLAVRRLGPGRYEVEGRRVALRWGIGPTFARDRPLVREENVGGGGGDWRTLPDEVELLDYLRQAANVAAAMNGRAPGAPGVAKLPRDLRVSFVNMDAPGAKITLKDIRMGLVEDGDERGDSMRLACEQAQLREYVAHMFEKNGPLFHGFSALGKVL